jgi:hypothetical protein
MVDSTVNAYDAKIRAAVQKTLEHWQTDTDLAGIREKEALEKLSEAERHDLCKLWDDVTVLATQAQAKAK